MRNSSIFFLQNAPGYPHVSTPNRTACVVGNPRSLKLARDFWHPVVGTNDAIWGTKGNRHQASLPPRLPGHFAPPIEACKVSRKEIFQKMLKGKKIHQRILLDCQHLNRKPTDSWMPGFWNMSILLLYHTYLAIPFLGARWVKTWSFYSLRFTLTIGNQVRSQAES